MKIKSRPNPERLSLFTRRDYDAVAIRVNTKAGSAGPSVVVVKVSPTSTIIFHGHVQPVAKEINVTFDCSC